MNLKANANDDVKVDEDVIALLQWLADPDQQPTSPAQLIKRLRTDAVFRCQVASELHMQGKLQAVQTAEPRWLALQSLLDTDIKTVDFDESVMLQIDAHQPLTKQRRQWHMAALFAMAATIAIGVFALMPWLSRHQPSDAQAFAISEMRDNGVALLSSSVGAVWADRPEITTGSILPRGELTLEKGLVEITFYRGARVIVEAPAKIKLETENSAVCFYGKMRAQVPKQAHGFSITSAQFDLVDIGTEFGIDVAPTGEAKVHVFVGEVQLYAPDGKRSSESLRRVLGGDGVAWAASGLMTEVVSSPLEFTSFDEVHERQAMKTSRQYAAWRQLSQARASDPRVVSFFDFEQQGRELLDHGTASVNGTVISSNWVDGRWPGKGALEFNQASDRVRLEIPGEFDEITMAAWIRLDALPNRRQALLLTDAYNDGHIHWQIYPGGELRFGFRGSHVKENGQHGIGIGHASPVIFTTNHIGNWNFIATTYERQSRTVTHYFNGQKVSHAALPVDERLKIGPCEIGNWGQPLKDGPRSVRNLIGRIDELTIWKTALTAVEISDQYQATKP